jgi:hypothetical protein
MPVSCQKIKGKWRVTDPDGSIAKNDAGTAVDGGGHDTESRCTAQARAINAGTHKQSVPRLACIFSCPAGAVQFVAGENEPGHFAIRAYDGGITKHWYWGNLALDLRGLKFAAMKLPVLDSHFTESRIGFTTEQIIDAGVQFTGQFLRSEKAQGLRKDMQDGFPMQASLWPVPSRIEQVEEGATSEVNGQTLHGPGAIFREATIKEVSMCVFGALQNTTSTALADRDTEQVEFELMERDDPMAKEDKPALTVETFKAENPALHQTVFAAGQAEGTKLEKERFAALQKACGDDAVLLTQCFAGGLSLAETLQKANEKLAAGLKAAQEKLATRPLSTIDAATAEFKSQPAPKMEAERNAAQFDEARATDEQLKSHFEATSDLRDQFLAVEDYVAFVHADREGHAKILNRK